MKKLFLFATLLCFVACGPKQPQTPTITLDEETKANMDRITEILQKVKQISHDPLLIVDRRILRSLYTYNSCLDFQFDSTGMDSLTLATCLDFQQKVSAVHNKIDTLLYQIRQNSWFEIDSQEEHVMETKALVPVYLEKGDKLGLKINAEKKVSVKVYNADARSLIKTYPSISTLVDSLPIRYSAIYLIEIIPTGTQYVSYRVSFKAGTYESMVYRKAVKMEETEAKPGDFLVRSVKGIKMKSLFEEPRKFTLRGQLKTIFSGNDRSVVAVQIPSGATDILYSLRISTNEGNRYSDGKFHDNMEVSYKNIKMLGLPVYESHKGGGILATILGENQPPREEDAYINLYVFYNSAQAKKFQDGAEISKLQYNIDYSKIGTQSCSDRIPTKGYKTIYIGFLNERMRYNNYVWFEAVSAVPNTEYFKPTFSR